MKRRTVAWSVIVAVLVTCAFTTMAIAQSAQKPGGGGGGGQAAQWVIMTYVIANGCGGSPVALPVTKLKGGDVSFEIPYSFDCTPDRAMLLTEKFPKGTLIGHSLSAKIAIVAPVGTTFNYCGPNCDGTDPGGFVRLYIQGKNPDLVGCEAGWHPLRPDCEAQYWWSNPIHIDLADLALLAKGITLQEVLSPAFWSDRDGHMGNTAPGLFGTIPQIPVDHAAAFNAAVANATKMGLSFGGGGNFAFGTGASRSAQFLLYDFKTKK